jgi:hypothetical protein
LAVDRLRTDHTTAFAVRARRGAEAWEEVRGIQVQITTLASEAAERRYADRFADALQERDDVYRKAAAEVDAVTERALAKLARVRVPVEWSAQHSDLERRLVAYLAASRRLHATVEGDINPPATEAAARDFERAQADLSEFLREESREFVAYWRGPGVRHDDR